ncbi:protein INVOLVED IN DE NOVO 2-like [Primulina huaijiensis]|uniref:protein INVOLVED IN DE NOVO 2-like n=1 Tax=Primulina huaijiensis TaxID=1492673 RepID=UPI003CC739C6
MKNGKHQVKISDYVYTCPCCPNMKKIDSLYKELLQHASGIGKCNSAKRTARDKANHVALAKYLENDMDAHSGPSEPAVEADALVDHDHNDEMFVWPWIGHSGTALVKDWQGFNNAMSFEKFYDCNQHGKRKWLEKIETKSNLYGWIARADDYNANNIVGENLHKIGNLRTVSNIMEEEAF